MIKFLLNDLLKKNTFRILVVVVLLIGIFVRLYGLQWYFATPDDMGVIKSILGAKTVGHNIFVVVPSQWTYAPFQFLITPLLVTLEQDYRSLLFWGRLPSSIFSILGLFALIIFYRKYDKRHSYQVLFALSILVCSYENIIMAHQAHNYALGVSAAIVLLILVIHLLKKTEFSHLFIIFTALILSFLSQMQYSILFFMPGFFLVLFFYGLKNVTKKIEWVVKCFLCFSVYLLTVLPTLTFFLFKQIKSGNQGLSDWNKGENLEFLFQWPQAQTLINKLSYTLQFFFINTWKVLKSNFGFVPENFFLLNVITAIASVLLILGIINFLTTKDKAKKWLGLFFLINACVWAGLVIVQKLTFSPTRHSAILLPFMVILVSEGLKYPFDKWKSYKDSKIISITENGVFIFISLSIIVLFSANYHIFLKDRKDFFNEHQIMETLKQFNVDTVIAAQWTHQVECMKEVRDFYDSFDVAFSDYTLIARKPTSFKTIAWISRNEKLVPEKFEKARRSINMRIYIASQIRKQKGQPEELSLFKYPLEIYQPLAVEINETEAESEYLSETKTGKNAYYLYILRRP